MPERRFDLGEREIPRKWFNLMPEMAEKPPPPLHPGTGEPIGPDALAPIFPMALIEQEVSTEAWIPIPEEILDIYRLWRPTPLFRADRLEKALGTPARIYYKYEGVSPAGSHKPNTAVAQAFYNAKEGVKRLATETGAGQWGSALAFACNQLGLECKVYMVRVSYDQKPYRRSMMQTWGASVIPSPSNETESGKKILARDPDSAGSLGIAISEAVEDAAKRDDTKYSLGSVLNHVLLHQTVIGLEAKKAFERIGDAPDVVVGCTGGGSNFAGIAFPYLADKIHGGKIRIVAVEPAACPTLTRGEFRYDFGDTAQMTPLLPMYTLGHDFIPPSIHSGGLRYHGMAPLVSQLVKSGLVEPTSYMQTECFDAGILFARTEGILPAPEATHAVKGAIAEAERCKQEGKAETILFNLCGHGHLDLAAYDAYFSGKLEDFALPQSAIDEAMGKIDALPRIG
ncbi:MAG: TrpB-like pyridoxal phosphate-dependent enzyme [Candidatus Eisenbacteria bacterium]|nr:TrpB-like pyridoxal phosphate-dependent enzyme [Candidatus Latescibacterota bacterium]MBD3301670.1 TrpB-like pyridoxal phosphate-dependent enzyme [Candidatus Eisenbacteria bacterium]